MGKVLVACEYSGIVRDAFRARGHDAISCDLRPTLQGGPHAQGDVRVVLQNEWDLVIAHPPCTYLANSGVRWLHQDLDRWPRMMAGAQFFLDCLNANAPRVAVENPVMHRHARQSIGRGPDFTIQPWHFGDSESKRTCFWLRGLPPLINMAGGLIGKPRQSVFRQPPSPDRAARRSLTFPGIADAMAQQWGPLLP